MKKNYDSFRTTRAAPTMLLMGLLMLAAITLQAQTLTLDQADVNYAPDETVFITGTAIQAHECIIKETFL
jgi:hypothetical protein